MDFRFVEPGRIEGVYSPPETVEHLMAIATHDYSHTVCRLLRKHTCNHWIDVLCLISKRNIVTIPQVWFRESPELEVPVVRNIRCLVIDVAHLQPKLPGSIDDAAGGALHSIRFELAYRAVTKLDIVIRAGQIIVQRLLHAAHQLPVL